MATQVLSPGQIPDTVYDGNLPEEWRENLNVHMICPECQDDPPNLVDNFADGDTVCATCGLVLDNRVVDTRSEWRTFANDESGTDDPSRVGSAADPLLNGSQLETSIQWGVGSNSRELHRAHSKLATDSNNKALKEAYAKISSYCAVINLPDDAVKFAQETFKEVHDQKTFKGKNTNNTLAGCLFIASRRTGYDRTFKTITGATGVSKKDIGRAFKAIEHFVREKRKADKRAGAGAALHAFEAGHAVTRPSALVEPICQKLDLNRLVIKISREIAEKLMSTDLIGGRSPLTVAAVAVYIASHFMGQPKSPKDIAYVAEVSDGTIRTSARPVVQNFGRIMEQRWLIEGGSVEKLPQL